MGFFGKKAAAAVEEAEPALRPEFKAEASRAGSRKLWGVLLVLSIVMVFIFGGAVAGLVYMRVTTPPLAQLPRPAKARKSAPPAAPEAPKAEAPKPAEPKTELKAPEDAKAVETKPSDRPTGSPAVHAATLPKRSAEPLAAAAKAAAPAAPPVAAKPAAAFLRTRAVAIEFAHSAPSAKEVLLRAPFLVRTGGKQAMLKDSEGVWKLTLSLLPGTYKYSFIVDGKRTPNESRQVP